MRTLDLSEPDSAQQRKRRRKRPQAQPIRAKLHIADEGPSFQSEAMTRLLECLEAGATHGLGTLAHAAETLGIVAILPMRADEVTPDSLERLTQAPNVPDSDIAYYWTVLERDGVTEQCRTLLHKAYTAVCTLPRAMDAYHTLTRMAHVKQAGAQARFSLTAGQWAQWVLHSLAWLAAQSAHRFSDKSVDVRPDGTIPAMAYLVYDEALAKQERKERDAWHKVYASSSPQGVPSRDRRAMRKYLDSLETE